MKEQLEFIHRRHSVRKFTDAKIPQADFEALFEAATLAPSGVNIQNWQFVVIENPEQIKELAEIVVKKVHNIANRTKNEELKKSLIGKIPYQTVFKEAPYVVLVFAGEYPTAWPELLAEGVIDPEEFQRLMRPNPAVQNTSAAMENLLLAAAALGYGGCWMTGPTIAAKEISEFVGFEKEGYHLVSMTPLGVPAFEGKNPPRKPLSEVVTFKK